MALLSVLIENDRETAFARLATPSKVKEKINRGILRSRELIGTLPLQDPAKIYRAMNALDIETILFAMAIASDDQEKREISHYLIELRKVKSMVGGEDLRAMGILPGPVYSDILGTLLDERLRGTLKTREDEIAFVRERYATLLKNPPSL
jgi:tRNA nucleotidyltransferase (CCA-adding enzyme)